MSEKYKRKPNCKCKECEKEIYRRPKTRAHGDVFCSTKCANIRNKKDGIKCLMCETLIPRRKNAKTCSRECSNRYRTGIHYKLGRPKDKAAKYHDIKKQLIEERGGKCNRCSCDKTPILHAHHIIERSAGGSDDPSNLELLCPTCHAWHHYLKRTQIEEYEIS